MILGITGGLATGKSSAASFLAELGLRIVDSDEVAHYLTRYDTVVLTAIRSSFGPAAFKPGGALDRARLAELAFANESARHKLEEILHPPISGVLMENIRWAKQTSADLIVVIPLLFENAWENILDRTVVISCSPQLQVERALARGFSLEQVHSRIAAQMPLSLKEAKADAVVGNNGTLEELRTAVRTHWEGCSAASENE